MPGKITERMRQRILTKLTEAGCEFIEFRAATVGPDKYPIRRVIYKCHCGKEGDHLKQNILRDQWKGCAGCSKKRVSSDNVKELRTRLESKECQLIDVGDNRRVAYRCSCGAIGKTYVGNILYKQFDYFQGCPSCHNRRYHSRILKSSFQIKDVVFPSGRVEKCQGYENFAFLDLARELGEDDIVVGWPQERNIAYPNPDKGGKISFYNPDGFIKSRGWVIEVKSPHTYRLHAEKNEAKFRAVARLGFVLNYLLYDATGGGKDAVKIEDALYLPPVGTRVKSRIEDAPVTWKGKQAAPPS